jgi:hypothetical protein
MGRGFPVRIFRSDVGGSRSNFRRWAVYVGNEHFADINATAVRGYAPRVSVTTRRGRVVLARVAKEGGTT